MGRVIKGKILPPPLHFLIHYPLLLSSLLSGMEVFATLPFIFSSLYRWFISPLPHVHFHIPIHATINQSSQEKLIGNS
jgi:hypothetical protein